ncbi:MAG TPA: TolC family protein [Bacillota bacterium]
MRKIILTLLIIFTCVSGLAGVIAAAEEGQLLTPDQAVAGSLDSDSSLRAAQLAMEVAADEYNAARRIFSLGGSYSQSQSDPVDIDSSTESLMINSGGTSGDPNAWWSLSASQSDASLGNTDVKPGQTYNLTLTPFNLSQAINTKSKEVALAGKTQAYETTKITLSTGIRTTYAEVVEKAALLQIAREDLDLTKAHLKQVNVFYNVGKIAKLDLMDAEQQVKASEAKLASADLSYQTALLKLSIALGKPDLKGYTFRSEALKGIGADQIDIQQTLDRCLKDSPEVKGYKTQMELAGLNLRMSYFFQLSGLQLGASVYKPKDPLEGQPKDVTTYSLKIQGALDDSPFRNLAMAKKNFKAAQDTLDFTVKTMQTKVLDSLRLWKMAELSLEPMDQTINVAKERLRIANLKYDNGMASTSEVNETRKALIASEEAYWQSWYNLIQAREGFYQAVWGNPAVKNQ